MEIRFAREGDIPRIIDLLYQVGQVHYDLRPDVFRPVTLKYDHEQVLAILQDENRPVFIAAEGDEVLGFGFCVIRPIRNHSVIQDMTEFYIDDLCVDENHRSQGIGKALYRHIYAHAKALGCRAVTLNVWNCNSRALKFYEKLGLKPQRLYMEDVLGE